MAIHPRVTVNPMTTIGMPLAEAAELWTELGTVRVGLNAIQMERTGWREGLDIVRHAGLDVVYLNYGPAARVDDAQGWQHDQAVLERAIDAAALLGADCVYFCTGSPGTCLFEEAAEHLARRLAPVLDHAAEREVRLTLEPCVSSRPELGFVHTVRDALTLAERLGMGVCVDFYACWMEPRLGEQLAANAHRIDLVQISDFVVGTLAQPNRWVPGDGDLPLGPLLDLLAASGYEGAIDLEMLGPRIDEEGAASALRRGTEWLSAALDARGM
jgi:sugar phosphate isomerase/epimerase